MSAAVALDYSALQDIREEAGHQHQQVQENMTGLANGANLTFYVAKLPIVDYGYNDVVDVTDVIVYANGVAVDVASIDANTGAITLVAPPANGAVMKCTYRYSTVTDMRVTGVRREAIAYVQRRLNGIVDYALWQTGTTEPIVPPDIVTVVRLFAAALIMIRSYGSNTDNELVSKDGYKKLQAAKSLLSEYLESVADDSGSNNPVSAVIKTDGNLFPRNTNLTDNYTDTNSTEEFFHKDN